MGMILSRFRKKKTTIEVLEDLDTQIKKIEQYGTTTEQRHKKIVGTLLIYSVLLYIVTAVLFYFYFFPASLYDQLFYITPLLIFPLLIIFTKKMVTWYYKRKISRNQEKLSTMEKEKKKILEEVTETETYKKAKEILLKFAPDQLRMTPLTPQLAPVKVKSPTETPRRPSGPQTSLPALSIGGNDLRKRTFNIASPGGVSSFGTPNIGPGPSATGITSSYNTPVGRTFNQQNIKSPNALLMSPRPPLPRPILPQQRSYLDRLVEYLVGDGPSNRYALICHQCDSHNGMALKEEFEYFGFRCCFCNYWNPARKQKPSAPKLDNEVAAHLDFGLKSQKLTEIDASNSSGTDSDIEVVEKPEDELPEKDKAEKEVLEVEQDIKNLEEEKKNPEINDAVLNEDMEIDESPRKET